MSLRLRDGVLAALACLLLGACVPVIRDDIVSTTFVVVRHAEKVDDGSDPSLAPAGQARARALAHRLRGHLLGGAYATGYRRTQETAQPTARSHGMKVTPYDARMPVAEFAAQLRREHRSGTVLVVGHSNTAPEIAAALCACTVAPMGETEFDRLMTVTVEPDGRATYHEQRY